MVKLAVYDYISSTTGKRIYLNALNDENIGEIKEKILIQVKHNLKGEDDAKSNGVMGTNVNRYKIKNKRNLPRNYDEITVDDLIVYIGAVIMDDSKSIEHYNVSELSELSLSLYLKVNIVVMVTVLKGISCFGIKYTPVYSFIINDKIMFNMIDQQTVLEIKKKILSEWEFVNKKGESIQLEDLNLILNGNDLTQNLRQINELKFKDKLKLKLIIPYGYKVKKL